MDARVLLKRKQQLKRQGLGQSLKSIKKRNQASARKLNAGAIGDLRELLDTQRRVGGSSVKSRIGLRTRNAESFSALKKVEMRLRNRQDNRSQIRATQRSNIERVTLDAKIPRVVIRNDLATRRTNRSEPRPSTKWRRPQSTRVTTAAPLERRLQPSPISPQVPEAIANTPMSSYFMSQRSQTPVTQSYATKPLRMDTTSMPNTSSTSLLVSNLQPTITQSDILELFGDIGEVLSLQPINPSSAIVTYKNSMDAAKACQAYNYRLLDGQPMFCTLLGSTAGPTYTPTPTIHAASHRAAAQALMSSGLLQPPVRGSASKNVKFTVKI